MEFYVKLVIHWNYTEMHGHQNKKLTFILMSLFHLLKDITKKISLNSIKIQLRPLCGNLSALSLHA